MVALSNLNSKVVIRWYFVWNLVRNVESYHNNLFSKPVLLPPASLTVFGFSKLPSSFHHDGTTSKMHATTDTNLVDPTEEMTRTAVKNELLDLITSTPINAPTPQTTTNEILTVVRELERLCPTPDDDVLTALGGNWELLWTSQDQTSDEWQLGPLRTWINPLENQSYSNNPIGTDSSMTGRANPVLPRPIQDRLEKIGIIEKASNDETPIVRSSQSIDIKRRQVRNVVGFDIPSLRLPLLQPQSKATQKASLTVVVDFKPNKVDTRKVDVKFQACRVAISKSPLDINIPLGIIGPTGWLRTGYIDENMRITRGHKGSVFVLCRPSSSPSGGGRQSKKQKK